MSKPSSKRDASAAAKSPETESGFFGRVRARRSRMGFEMPLGWLLSLLLVLQLVGTGALAGSTPLDQTVQPPGPSSLSAVLGEPVPICLHGEPGSPAPSVPADCCHCTLCHLMAGGVALSAVAAIAVPAAVAETVTYARVATSAPASRHGGGTSPRGPPTLA